MKRVFRRNEILMAKARMASEQQKQSQGTINLDTLLLQRVIRYLFLVNAKRYREIRVTRIAFHS